MDVLEDTPAVLSLGKLCDEQGYSYEWINGQKPHLIKIVFEYLATENQFERFEFEFRRRGNFFEGFEFLVCSKLNHL